MSVGKVSQGQTPAGAINRHLINKYSLSAHYVPDRMENRKTQSLFSWHLHSGQGDKLYLSNMNNFRQQSCQGHILRKTWEWNVGQRVKEGLYDKVVIKLRHTNDKKKLSMHRFRGRNFQTKSTVISTNHSGMTVQPHVKE